MKHYSLHVGDRVTLAPDSHYANGFYVNHDSQLKGVGKIFKIDDSCYVEWFVEGHYGFNGLYINTERHTNTYSKRDLLLADYFIHPRLKHTL